MMNLQSGGGPRRSKTTLRGWSSAPSTPSSPPSGWCAPTARSERPPQSGRQPASSRRAKVMGAESRRSEEGLHPTHQEIGRTPPGRARRRGRCMASPSTARHAIRSCWRGGGEPPTHDRAPAGVACRGTTSPTRASTSAIAIPPRRRSWRRPAAPRRTHGRHGPRRRYRKQAETTVQSRSTTIFHRTCCGTDAVR